MRKGIKITYIAITVNLGLALIFSYFLASDLDGLFQQLFDWLINLVTGILALYISGYFVGKKIEFLIKTKHWNSVFTGVIGLFVVLLFGTLIGSSVGFLEEGIANIKKGNTLQNELFDYYVKPLFWILFFGIIPTVIAGGIMGKEIKNMPQHPV